LHYGVLRATIYSEHDHPLAERLIFRKPKNKLLFTIETDKETYQPGETVNFHVHGTDPLGRKTPCYINVCVTDDSVLEMTDRREQPPRLPEMALLGTEVNRLEDSHVFLDETNPKSEIAVDLLLGTQGWRKFAFVDPQKFLDDLVSKSDKNELNARQMFAFDERIGNTIFKIEDDEKSISSGSESDGDDYDYKRYRGSDIKSEQIQINDFEMTIDESRKTDIVVKQIIGKKMDKEKPKMMNLDKQVKGRRVESKKKESEEKRKVSKVMDVKKDEDKKVEKKESEEKRKETKDVKKK